MGQPYINPNYLLFQNQIAPTLRGRIVSSIDDVTANDVPMDGSCAVFVKSDHTEIYTREWQPNGLITTKVYRLVSDVPPEESLDDRLGRLEERIAEIEKRGANNERRNNDSRNSKEQSNSKG